MYVHLTVQTKKIKMQQKMHVFPLITNEIIIEIYHKFFTIIKYLIFILSSQICMHVWPQLSSDMIPIE